MVDQTGQPYAYTGDNPVNAVDPLGTWPNWSTIWNVVTAPDRAVADFAVGVANTFCNSSFVGYVTGCQAGSPSSSGYGKLAYIAGEYTPYLPEPEAEGASAAASATSKAESAIWQDTKPFRGSTRTNGLTGSARRFYQWDYTHNDIEVYNGRGQHLGSMDPKSGEITKPAVPGRRIDT